MTIEGKIVPWFLVVSIGFHLNVATHHKSPKEPELTSPIDCARQCVEGEPPKVCYYNFTLEQYSVLGLACKLCKPTFDNEFLANCECVTADGIERMFLALNRMLPGPSIQVCQHDRIVVDVKNNIPGQEVTLHWHGIHQQGSPYYDGVPMVTQCPIHEATTFRYQFIAHDDGTHFYHSHDGLQRMDGLYGNLIVRQPKSVDIHGDLYDDDSIRHVILLSDWYHTLISDRFPGPRVNPGQTPQSLLVNGKGIYIDPTNGTETNSILESFEVEAGKKYRFRLINSMSSVCTASFTIEDHQLTLIAADGSPIEPREVDTIISASGERYDFVLHANQNIKSYWIQVRGLEECNDTQAQQFAFLNYTGFDPNESVSRRPTYEEYLPLGVVVNNYNGVCNGADEICVSDLRSATDVPNVEPDVRLQMPFSIFQFNFTTLFTPLVNAYELYLIAPDSRPYGSLVDNTTFAAPSSPLLSQYDDIDPSEICLLGEQPKNCHAPNCGCAKVIDIPLNSVVELNLTDISNYPTLNHPFHLHGYSFNVLAVGNDHSICNETGYINTHNPPYKDTLIIPSNGCGIVRFQATNPGVWFFHCHFEMHTVIGMSLAFRVGKTSDLPSIPKGFPKCGNFLNPILPA